MQGNIVYFLNPSSKKDRNSVNITKPYPEKKLFVVSSSFNNILFVRYHLRIFYSLLVRSWIKKILKKLPKIDIVWCFESNIFKSLQVFKKSKRIFHVVDPMNENLIAVAKTVDLTVCVSKRILQQFESIHGVKKMTLNHALSRNAIQQAKEIDFNNYLIPDKLRVGYIGNLSLNLIDRKTINTIIYNNPMTEFHFWGPGKGSNLGGETNELIDSLEHLGNVFFHKAIPSEDIINTIKHMDIFLLAYNNFLGYFDGSNSHKILEYLATGKVVVSTYIDQYSGEEFADFLLMSPDGENDKLPQLFKDVVDYIDIWNSNDKMQMRREFATNQSYQANVANILALINE